MPTMTFRRESKVRKRERAAQILAELELLYPDAETELDFDTPFQCLIATLLSAQATDVSVNLATPALFAAYPDAHALAAATPEEVEPYIKTIGLFRTKAKNAVATARLLVEIATGKCVTPKRSAEMMALLARNPATPEGGSDSQATFSRYGIDWFSPANTKLSKPPLM